MKNFAHLVSLSALIAFCSASAHATLQDQKAAAGSYRAVMRIPHGCNGQAAHTVRIEIPEGLYGVKPMPKAGWKLRTVVGAYAQPFENHGKVMTEGVKEIIWSGGNLPDDWYDEFVFRGTLAKLPEGTVLAFKTTQECKTAKVAWVDGPEVKDAKYPAPKLTIIAPSTSPAAAPAAPTSAPAPTAPEEHKH